MAYCDDVFQNETGKNRYCGPPACPPWHRFRPSVRVSPSHRCAPQGEIRLLPEHGVVHHDPGHGAVRAHLRLRHGQRQLLQVRGWGWQRGLRGAQPCSAPAVPTGRRTTRACLTTTSRRGGWMSAGCTWCTRGPPAPGTASSPKKPSSPAGPRGRTSSSATRRGQGGRRVRQCGWKPLDMPGIGGLQPLGGQQWRPRCVGAHRAGLDPPSPPSCRPRAGLDPCSVDV